MQSINRNWRNYNDDMKRGFWFLAIFITFIIGLVLLSPTRVSVAEILPLLLIGVVVFLFVGNKVYNEYQEMGNTLFRYYYVTPGVAHQVVESVLQAKPIPYKQFGPDFLLTSSPVVIHVRLFAGTRYRPAGTRIFIGPYGDEASDLLIETLLEKLDAAFAPQGLKK